MFYSIVFVLYIIISLLLFSYPSHNNELYCPNDFSLLFSNFYTPIFFIELVGGIQICFFTVSESVAADFEY